MRPRAPLAPSARPAAVLLGLSLLFSTVLGEALAQTSTPEPILFLGIQRSSNTDRVGSDLVREYLVDRGEILLKNVQLAEVDRRCRRQQCLSDLAAGKGAVLVLSGDVSSTGPTRNLRVQVRLFDQRRRGTPDAIAEIENLCIDCDETKLGIMLTGSTSELLTQYRQFAVSSPPPVSAQPPGPTATPAQASASPSAAPAAQPAESAWPAWMPRPASVSPPAAVPSPPTQVPMVAPTQAPPPSSPPPAVAYPSPPPATRPAIPYAVPPTAAVPPYPPAESGDQSPPVAVRQAPPQLPPSPPPPSPVPLVEPVRPTTPTPARKPLSPVRKGIAAVFGILGFGSLITAAVMHGLDRRLTPDLSINSMGTACQMPENSGRSCVLSTVGVYAPTYAVGALLVGGMILTLTIPESKPRPLSEPLIP